MDRVAGVNHDQIASIGHRTIRHPTVLGGTIDTLPVIRRPPKTDEEVEEIKKICYNTEVVRLGLATAGKAVSFTAVTLVMSTMLWVFSNIRFCSEMGLLLALWMAVSLFSSCTFVPALLVLWKPKFFLRATEEGIIG